MILLDTSGLLAALFADQNEHAACVQALAAARPPLLLSPFVLAELDDLIGKLAGVDDEIALLQEVRRGAYTLAEFGPADIAAAVAVVERYRDQAIGLADASIVVLAERHRCYDVLTLDRRHFGSLKTRTGKRLRLVPAN